MKKQRNFLDLLFDVLMELKSPINREEKIEVFKDFLKSLPNIVLEEAEVLPQGTLLKGSAMTCSAEQYMKLSKEKREGKKIDFDLCAEDSDKPTINLYKSEFLSYTGAWDQLIEKFVDEIVPGDHMLWMQFRKEPVISMN